MDFTFRTKKEAYIYLKSVIPDFYSEFDFYSKIKDIEKITLKSISRKLMFRTDLKDNDVRIYMLIFELFKEDLAA